MSTRDVLCLAAVALVVVVVSLPRLRDFAVRENELDAIRFARELSALAETLPEFPSPPAAPASNIGTLLTSIDRPELTHGAELLKDGALLCRHGYLFDLFRAAEDGWVVRAWPWEHGTTGVGAFVVLPDGAIYGHANPARDWSGPERPPRLAGLVPVSPTGWRRL